MGDMFIVPDVTVCASLQIININIRDTWPWETDWTYRSLKFRGRLRAAASLFMPLVIVMTLGGGGGGTRYRPGSFEQECILFCAGKTRVISNCSHLFRSRMLRSCQFRVGVPYFAQVCTTFVVYSVTNSKSNARKNG